MRGRAAQNDDRNANRHQDAHDDMESSLSFRQSIRTRGRDEAVIEAK